MRFPKERRLLRRREFLWVQRHGRRYNIGDLIVCVCPTPGELTRIGITTSKRVGKAVTRNRVRRLIRETARLHLIPAIDSGFAIVVIAKKNLSVDISLSQIEKATHSLISHLKKWLLRNPSQKKGQNNAPHH